MNPAPAVAPCGNVIAVYSPKGGAGCTTLAVNLAIALRRRTWRETVLVDGALAAGELDLHLNLAARGGLAAVAAGTPLEGACVTHATGVHLLSGAGAVAADLERFLATAGRRPATWFVLDTSPQEPAAADLALAAADRIVVPLFLDVAHLRRAKRDLPRLESSFPGAGDPVFTAWAERSDVDSGAAARILGATLGAELPYDPAAARRAINRGIPLLEADPSGASARAFARLADSLDRPDIRAIVPVGPTGPVGRILAWLRPGAAPSLGV
ncbi:MAG: hypothetical protein FJZ01_17285 [Candidatus Sericytochromatia bacterium]|nr:hypothetical protein [Candidatus Tanganyikabacteria bacterium]